MTHAVTLYSHLRHVPGSEPEYDTLGHGALTTEHAASSYGQPVLLWQGRAYSIEEASRAGIGDLSCLTEHRTPVEHQACCRWQEEVIARRRGGP